MKDSFVLGMNGKPVRSFLSEEFLLRVVVAIHAIFFPRPQKFLVPSGPTHSPSPLFLFLAAL